MDVKIYCPSYKRADTCFTHVGLPQVTYVVHEDEADAYLKNHDKVIGVSSENQGSYPKACNYILRNNRDKRIVIMDDDVSGIFRFVNRKPKKLNCEQVDDFIYKASNLVEEFGAKYWGVNIIQDKQAYVEYTPFSTVSYCGGPFQGFVYNDLLFDEEMLLKEDYDMTLQQLNKYRKVFRFNMYHYVSKQSNNVGGCATYRNFEEESYRLSRLQKKWGSHIVQVDVNNRSHNLKKKKKKFDYNPIIRPPIKGV